MLFIMATCKQNNFTVNFYSKRLNKQFLPFSYVSLHSISIFHLFALLLAKREKRRHRAKTLAIFFFFVLRIKAECLKSLEILRVAKKRSKKRIA